MDDGAANPTYHALLIGIDRYPVGYNSLFGCVNDIDAIEDLLLSPPGIGIPPERIQVTRLAAAHHGSTASPHHGIQTLPPTKANLIHALKALAGPGIKGSDRVLIYYSGHGDEKLWTTSAVWHEALVPHNDRDIEYLFDVEVNALVQAIATRTTDLTVVLDCCHSAGATRDLTGVKPHGEIRALRGSPATVAPPDITALGPSATSDQDRAFGIHMLQQNNPEYVVVVACQSDEKAGEGAFAVNKPRHGVFTDSFLTVLRRSDPGKRADLCWGAIWQALLAEVATRNAQLNQRTQHPWIIGCSERKVFGGPWERMDVGYPVTKRHDGNYEIGAGKLIGLNKGAEIAVYGAHPRFFPPVGSPEDLPVGRLDVKSAGSFNAVAHVVGATFELPDWARGRLVKPGESQRLTVSLKHPDLGIEKQLQKSEYLELVPSMDPNAEVEVVTLPDGGWIIGNDVEAILATVPAGQIGALRVGLEHYYCYNAVLRIARNCNNPQTSNSLAIQLLDCNDDAALRAMSQEELADPKLPEAGRDGHRVYSLQKDSMFCIKVTNTSSYDLNVTLLNCSARGLVEYLCDALLRAGASHVMWSENNAGAPFIAGVDQGPADTFGLQLPKYVTDRMIAIGTMQRDLKLDYLKVDKRVQDAVNQALATRAGVRFMRYAKTSNAMADVWAAAVIPVRISVE